MNAARKTIYLIKPETDRQNFVMAPPLGILYLAGALEKAGWNVRAVHERMTPEREKELIARILADDPLFVGISTFTGPSLLPALSLSRRLRRESRVPVVWGGLHATMLPEQTLQEEAVSVAVRGEGEETVLRLAEVFARSGESWADEAARITGVALRTPDGVRVNEMPPFIADLDAYPPAWHLLDMRRYIGDGQYVYTGLGSQTRDLRIATVMSSRGCPGRCGYCYNQFVNHRTFRTHSVPFVLHHVAGLRERYGVNAVVFEDDCLFTDRERALRIVQGMGLPWASSIRADYLARWGEPFLLQLKDSGCFELRIGAESGSPSTLEIMHKDIRREHILRSAELCLKHGIHVMMGFMIGVPGESWAEMCKTFDIIDELEAMGVSVTPGPSLFFPYPGTPLFDEAVRAGFTPPASTAAWGIPWGPSQPLPPYVDPRARHVGFYRSLAMRKDPRTGKAPLPLRPLQALARWRWRRRNFRLPLDYTVPHRLLALLRRTGLRRLAGRLE